MVKTTTKFFAVSVISALAWAPVCSWAGVQSALPMLLGAASLGDDGRSATAQADQLLREARQAMSEGNYTVADFKISRAEALQPKYSLFHSGDTPKKARADLEKQTQKSASPDRTSRAASGKDSRSADKSPKDPFLAHQSQATADGAPQTEPGISTADLAGQTVGPQSLKPGLPNGNQPSPIAGAAGLNSPVMSSAPATTLQPTNVRSADAQKVSGRSTQPLADANSPNPWDVDGHIQAAPAVAASTARPQSDASFFDARRNVTNGDARSNAALPVSPMLSPAALPLDPAAQQIQSINAVNKQQAVEMTRRARAAMAKGDSATAEQIARQAEILAPDTAYAPSEDRPGLVLLDIQRTKRNGTTGAVQAGGAWPAEENRYPGANTLYTPASDHSRNIPATQLSPAAGVLPVVGGPLASNSLQSPSNFGAATTSFMPIGNQEPTPENGTGEAMRWYRLGVQAVGQSKSTEALQAFRRAYAFQTELDPLTRQQLYDHLKILGENVETLPNVDGVASETVSAPVTPLPASTTLARGSNSAAAPLPGVVTPAAATAIPGITEARTGDTSAVGRFTAHQIAAEVARQQSQAKEMKEKRPKQALEMLQRTREMVASASVLETPAREQLLRRLDVSIHDVQQYIAENAPQIELTEKNQKIQDDVDRTRKQKVEVQERLAYLVNDFDKAMEEQRWGEAQVLAKRATELDPENPVVTQINFMAKMARRNAQNSEVQSLKEDGFVNALEEVDQSSIPFSGEISFPDAKKWDKLTKSPFRQKREGGVHRSPQEQEIERRLTTPVPLKFQQRPLSEVIDYLGKIANVPTHLDPLGLQAEGVGTDTPVTIDLRQDISLKSALKLILEPLRLTYVIKDEVLLITSEDVRRGRLYTVTYPVGDLVIRIPNFAPNGEEGIPGALKRGFNTGGNGSATGGGFGFANQMVSNDAGGSNVALNPALLAQMRTNGFPIIGSGQTQTGSPQSIPFGPGGLKGGAQADFDSLIDLITSTIATQTWSDVGGPGTIEGFDTNLSLVVSQTQEVHEEIADLLQQLRRLQDLQVTIEVRFITLEDDFFERIGVDFDFNIATHTNPLTFTPTALGPPPSFGGVNPSENVGLDPTGQVTPLRDIQFRQGGFTTALPPFGGFDAATAATFGFAILSDIEAFFVIQAAQGDTRTNILQAPKVTLFNGQQATVSDTSQRPFVTSVIPVVGDFAAAQQPVIVVLSEGTSLTVQAVVSNDRRFVRLTVVPFFSQIGKVDEFTFTGSTSSTKKSSEDKSGTDTSATSSEDDSSSTGTTVQLPTFSFVTVTTTVSVPDGGTVLLGGIKRLSEGRNERGVPVLSKLPYINRLFRNVGIGRTTSSLMMMVTPRIIIQEEEEQNLLGTGPQQP